MHGRRTRGAGRRDGQGAEGQRLALVALTGTSGLEKNNNNTCTLYSIPYQIKFKEGTYDVSYISLTSKNNFIWKKLEIIMIMITII